MIGVCPPPASKFLGIDSGNLVGMQIADLMPQPDAQHLRKHLENVRGQTETTIVESHSGQIAVQNNTEGGCTFWFTLPRQAP